MRKIYFYTLGCRLNQSETSTLKNEFSQAGYVIVNHFSEADLVVINTCTVTSGGDQDTRRFISKLNRDYPGIKVALIGCQSESQGEKLLDSPNVQWVIGTNKKMSLLSLIEKEEDHSYLEVGDISKEDFSLPIQRKDDDHTRANLKVQDGCNFFCSYCIIPYARGRARSRDFQNLLEEANALVLNGHKEIVITGVNIGTYSNQGKTISQVVEALNSINHLKRIRLSSLELSTLPEDFLSLFQHFDKLCRYLHIPLQNGADKIIKAMNRKVTYPAFRDFILQAYEEVNNVCLGTDVIVGFPGEGEKEFEETYSRLESLPLSYIHVFSYSDREGTRSHGLPKKVPPGKIKERSKILRELSQRKREAYLKKFIGKKVEVLFEENKGEAWQGLTDNFIRVRVSSEKNLDNQFYKVRLSHCDYPLMNGTIIS